MNRTAVVTGSSSGIGRGIAQRLIDEGWHVVTNGYGSQEVGAALVAELGRHSTYVDADVSSMVEAQRLVAAAESIGRLELIVNNAGVARRVAHDNLEGVDDDFWNLVMAVNLRGPWNMVKAARASLTANRGQVVNIASVAGLVPIGSSVPYAVSKAGVIHLTRLLAKSLGPEIRVNALAPGYVDTPLSSEFPELQDYVSTVSPARRPGTPSDIAEAVVGLTRMDYVTGAVIPVDGGLSLI